ncbi:AIPR family protein [Solibacillus cecembensis]|uniref:AIPR family protein n=1 Tax=Solibacillus cecembensis TaxID=459347 RepID=UPI003CFF244A
MVINIEQAKIIRNRIDNFKEKYNIDFEKSIGNREIINNGWDKILFSEFKENQLIIGMLLNTRYKINDLLSEIILSYNEDIDESTEFYLLIITKSVKEKIILLKSEFDKNLKKLIMERCSINIKYGRLIIEVATAFIPEIDCKPAIGITDRIRVANYSKDNSDIKIESSREGAVYTANLIDLIKLYEQTGEDIFKANLRIGIDDVLGVNSEIQNTLRNNPEDFWFLNNGITLILPKSSINKSKYNKLILENIYSKEKELKISIINGAQTITAASSFLLDENSYGKESEDTRELKDKAKSSAKVILKIITYDDKLNESENRKFINKVSVALNRQKPIKGQDIALVSSFVLSINEFYQSQNNKGINELDKFFIIRRGEIHSIPDRHYDLSKLVKVLKAILGKNPSAIRNIKLDNLLAETKNNNDGLDFDVNEEIILKDKTIFKPKILLSTYTNQREVYIKQFNENYSFVNDIMEIESLMEEHSNAIFKTERKKLKVEDLLGEYILENQSDDNEVEKRRQRIYAMATSGRYHLLSCIFYSECYKQLERNSNTNIESVWEEFLNNGDFTEIKLNAEFKEHFMDIKKYLKLIEGFIEFWVKFKRSEINNPSLYYANEFKVSKDDYEMLREYVKYANNIDKVGIK